jgi:hypothetical protein
VNVLTVRNVHQALPRALHWLHHHGVERESRNGPVVMANGPFTTEYLQPRERLVFWALRDVNPAFLVAEALWMLAGRNDLPLMTKYIKDFGRYSDDGVTLHGAYGNRWRLGFGFDQLAVIAKRLTENPDDRRCVLQMWDAPRDLQNHNGAKDVPCNDMATFQRDAFGELDMVVFNRSNDAIWGAYYANAYHFSLLQEYLAMWIGCEVNRYWQVSSNFHAYKSVLDPLSQPLRDEVFARAWSVRDTIEDPYARGEVRADRLDACGTGLDAVQDFDVRSAELLHQAEMGFAWPRVSNDDHPWFNAAWVVLRAHERWNTLPAPERYEQAERVLATGDPKSDLVVSMKLWIAKRRAAWEAKQEATA